MLVHYYFYMMHVCLFYLLLVALRIWHCKCAKEVSWDKAKFAKSQEGHDFLKCHVQAHTTHKGHES
jgi:hypothetical protein